MRRLIRPIALAALALAGCATVPAPLQGQYTRVSPRDAIASEQRGVPVRWGGRIVSTEPLADRTCFEIVSTGLDATGRPRWAADDTGGRSIQPGLIVRRRNASSFRSKASSIPTRRMAGSG